MRVKQGLVKVVIGEKGNNYHKWHRISRNDLNRYASYLETIPSFYYAKVYEYVRLGKRKGYVTKQIAFINWDKNNNIQVKEV